MGSSFAIIWKIARNELIVWSWMKCFRWLCNLMSVIIIYARHHWSWQLFLFRLLCRLLVFRFCSAGGGRWKGISVRWQHERLAISLQYMAEEQMSTKDSSELCQIQFVGSEHEERPTAGIRLRLEYIVVSQSFESLAPKFHKLWWVLWNPCVLMRGYTLWKYEPYCEHNKSMRIDYYLELLILRQPQKQQHGHEISRLSVFSMARLEWR